MQLALPADLAQGHGRGGCSPRDGRTKAWACRGRAVPPPPRRPLAGVTPGNSCSWLRPRTVPACSQSLNGRLSRATRAPVVRRPAAPVTDTLSACCAARPALPRGFGPLRRAWSPGGGGPGAPGVSGGAPAPVPVCVVGTQGRGGSVARPPAQGTRGPRHPWRGWDHTRGRRFCPPPGAALTAPVC